MKEEATRRQSVCTFHEVHLDDALVACIAFRRSPDSLQALLTESNTSTGDHTCTLPAGGASSSPELGAPFEPQLSAKRVSSIAWRLLQADGQAMSDFRSGRPVSKRIPIPDPAVLRLGADTPTITDYREMRQAAAELIRPTVLSSPESTRLRPFQVSGVQWLVNHNRAILADDMGLGKTVQAIQALRILFNSGLVDTVLVVCPKSLLTNWEEELTRWAPELSRLRMTPPAKIRDEAWRVIWGRVHVVLTNYEQVRSPPPTLLGETVDVVIADEAHRARNLGSLVARGLRKLRWRRFWALTGTPIERDPADLATLLSTIEPDRFSVGDKSLHPSSLRSQARPYILRRMKSDVLAELPEVLESKETLELLPGQQRSYRAVARRLSRVEASSVLAIINQLRAICDVDEATGESIKAERIVEILHDVKASGEKAVVFSYLLQPLDILQTRLVADFGAAVCVGLRGSMNSESRDLALKRFKCDQEARVLLCSSRVGGEGLTLTEANHVIFFNEWWNPSANAQARDRVVRIGQRRGVHVYKFKCKGTIEETLEAILETKSKTIMDLVDRLAEGAAVAEHVAPILNKLKASVLSQSD